MATHPLHVGERIPVSPTNRTVVVTGIGATTPLGGDAASTWEGLLAGRSGVKPLSEEWAAELPVRIAAQVAVDPTEVLAAPAGPQAGPLGAVRADRGPRGVGGRRLRRAGRRGRTIDPDRLGVGHRLRHRRRDDPARPVRRAEGEGRTPRLPAHRAHAHAERPVRQRRSGGGRPGRRAHPGLRLRVGRRGHRLRRRDDPHRPRRRRRRRRHRGGDPPAADRRVRQHDGDVQEQRRARERLASLRHGP